MGKVGLCDGEREERGARALWVVMIACLGESRMLHISVLGAGWRTTKPEMNKRRSNDSSSWEVEKTGVVKNLAFANIAGWYLTSGVCSRFRYSISYIRHKRLVWSVACFA